MCGLPGHGGNGKIRDGEIATHGRHKLVLVRFCYGMTESCLESALQCHDVGDDLWTRGSYGLSRCAWGLSGNLSLNDIAQFRCITNIHSLNATECVAIVELKSILSPVCSDFIHAFSEWIFISLIHSWCFSLHFVHAFIACPLRLLPKTKNPFICWFLFPIMFISFAYIYVVWLNKTCCNCPL